MTTKPKRIPTVAKNKFNKYHTKARTQQIASSRIFSTLAFLTTASWRHDQSFSESFARMRPTTKTRLRRWRWRRRRLQRRRHTFQNENQIQLLNYVDMCHSKLIRQKETFPTKCVFVLVFSMHSRTRILVTSIDTHIHKWIIVIIVCLCTYLT